MWGVSHLLHKEKVMKCEERVYSIRRATSAVGGQGVWCEEKPAIKGLSHLQYEERSCAVS